jgi:exonuclease VII large subunit
MAREKTIDHHSRVIRKSVGAVFSQIHSVLKRQNQQVHKTIIRLDFEKRQQQNQKSKSDIFKSTKQILVMISRMITSKESELQAHRNLVRASDPELILKKGFSLTLDEKKQVVQSLKQFKKVKTAWLRFRDGLAEISRKEEK